jgi:hypothetical protein
MADPYLLTFFEEDVKKYLETIAFIFSMKYKNSLHVLINCAITAEAWN